MLFFKPCELFDTLFSRLTLANNHRLRKSSFNQLVTIFQPSFKKVYGSERESYIKAAGGKKLGVWIQSILDAAVKQQKATGAKKKVEPTVTPDVKLVIDYEDDGDSVGNR
jgi:hypothetical protein